MEELKILYEGEDITKNLEHSFLSLTINDKLSGEADDLNLTLADKDKNFLGQWFPTRGSTIEVNIGSLDCGRFEVDEVTVNSPPTTCAVKATSIAQLSALRQVDESRSWENVKLSKIAKDIADQSNCELFFEAGFDPDISRAEQAEHSRLAFLEKICADWGLIVKVSDGKLIVYPEEQLETREAVKSIQWQELTHFNARATLNEVYKDCQVNYKHATHSELYSATATDSTKTAGKTLKINKKVSSQAEAEHLAKHELRKKNKHEYEVTLTKPFDADLQAGNNFELDDSFGFFKGKWLIDEATHSINRQGSITRVKAHRVQASS